MPKRCSICSDERCDAIDQEIMAQVITQKEISKKYGYSTALLSYHKSNHLLPKNSYMDVFRAECALAAQFRECYPDVCAIIDMCSDVDTEIDKQFGRKKK